MVQEEESSLIGNSNPSIISTHSTNSTISTSSNSTISVEEDWDQEVLSYESASAAATTLQNLSLDDHDTNSNDINHSSNNKSINKNKNDHQTESTPPPSPPSLSLSSTSTSISSTTSEVSQPLQTLTDRQIQLKKKELEILRKIEDQKRRERGWKITEGERGELLKKEMGEWINSDPLPYEKSH